MATAANWRDKLRQIEALDPSSEFQSACQNCQNCQKVGFCHF